MSIENKDKVKLKKLKVNGELHCKGCVNLGRLNKTHYIDSSHQDDFINFPDLNSGKISIHDMDASSGSITIDFSEIITFQSQTALTINVFNKYVNDNSIVIATIGRNDYNIGCNYLINVQYITDNGFTLKLFNNSIDNQTNLAQITINFLLC